MLDPGIKHEPGYFVYDSGSESNVWILREDGKPFIAKLSCAFSSHGYQIVKKHYDFSY